MERLKGFALCAVLTACAAATVLDAGCTAYGEMRGTMPLLSADPVSQWVAMVDSRMTGVCRK